MLLKEFLLNTPDTVAHISHCFEDKNMVIITRLNQSGYYEYGKFETEELAKQEVERINTYKGVTKAQQEAHMIGSMFGWNVPGTNPDNYDENGVFKMDSGII